MPGRHGQEQENITAVSASVSRVADGIAQE
jgi:hypothetical protein